MIDHQDQIYAMNDIFNTLLNIAPGTSEQKQTAIRSLWNTYQSEWLTFFFFKDPTISTSITNDVAHPWLDTVISGKTIRLHITDRLAEV